VRACAFVRARARECVCAHACVFLRVCVRDCMLNTSAFDCDCERERKSKQKVREYDTLDNYPIMATNKQFISLLFTDVYAFLTVGLRDGKK
jgi:hypothetical protein